MAPDIIHYFDYKSPYAYLAQADLFQLNGTPGIAIEWRPYTLDIPSFLGAAELDAKGRVISESRNEHQWRRVKYAYMDCRREATRRGVTLRGPRKIFDSSIAHIGFLYAQARGDFRRYHDTVYERFWRRELDIEDPRAIAETLSVCGIDGEEFPGFAAVEGRQLHDDIQREAEAQGVFGVPSYLVNGELFWGAERLHRAREAAVSTRDPSKRRK